MKMTYTAVTLAQLRARGATKAETLAREFGLVGTDLAAKGVLIQAGSKIAKVAVAGGSQNAIAFAWQNPETTAILVHKVILRITTQGATGSAVMDIGAVANATATADTLLDGVAITATGVFDNITNKGSNGLPQVVLDEKDGSTDYITGKILVAEAAALVGKVYIFYTVI
jgi:hypothetical protein